jgi:positive regulator of sigma E activity
MTEPGYVSRVEDGSAYVTLAETTACNECGVRLICRSDRNGGRQLKVSNNLDARVGNEVEVAEAGSFLIMLSVLQYGLPFTGFIAGIFLAYFMQPEWPGVSVEWLLFGSGLGGVFTAGWISWLISRRMVQNFSAGFTITRILS